MSIESIVKTAKMTRGFLLNNIKDLSDEQLLKVPETAKNNVLWNVGHVVYVNSSILHANSGVDNPVPESFKDNFKGGSSPSDWAETPNIEEVRELAKTRMDADIESFVSGAFDGFKAFELFPGYEISNAADAMAFNITHEALHVGLITALKRSL